MSTPMDEIPFGEPHSWKPSSLIRRAENPPEPPTIGGFLYPAKRILLSGETESLKTWFALILAKAEMDAGYSVGWADLDAMGVDAVLSRLRALGVSDDVIHDRFLYYDPSERLVDELLVEVCEEIAAREIRLFVIDAFNPMLSLHGLDPGSTPDIEAFWREIATPITAAGAAPTLLDHVVKNVDSRGKYAYGSERKASGAIVHIGFRILEQFTRGGTGRALLSTHKDRPGFLPRPTIGRLVLASDGEFITYELEEDRSHAGDTFRPTVLMERISVRLEKEVEPRSQTWIEENVIGNVAAKRDALAILVSENFVARERGVRGFEHTSARPYREADDVVEYVEATPSSPRPHPVPDLRSTPLRPRPPDPPYGGGDGVEVDPVDSPRPDPVPGNNSRWPLTARCPVCEMDKPARLVAGVTYLACGHLFVAEDAEIPF